MRHSSGKCLILISILLALEPVWTNREDFIQNELKNHFNPILKAEDYQKVDKILIESRRSNHNDYNRRPIDSYVIVYEKESEANLEEMDDTTADTKDVSNTTKNDENIENIENPNGEQDLTTKDEPVNTTEEEVQNQENKDMNQQDDEPEDQDAKEMFEGICFEPFNFDGEVTMGRFLNTTDITTQPMFGDDNNLMIEQQIHTVIKLKKDMYKLNVENNHSNCYLMMISVTDTPMDIKFSVDEENQLVYAENMNRKQFYDNMYRFGGSTGRNSGSIDINYEFDPDAPKYLNFICPFWEKRKDSKTSFQINAEYLSSSPYYFGISFVFVIFLFWGEDIFFNLLVYLFSILNIPNIEILS